MNVKLQCNCGAVSGIASHVSANDGNRVVCCCSDCQQFAKQLNRESDVLDEFGGTDIYQTAMSWVTINTGNEHIRCLRLRPKGIHRWYTECCKTPIGNTMGAGLPFVGLVHSFIQTNGNPDSVLGPVRACVQAQDAHGTPTYPYVAQKFPLAVTLRVLVKLLGWKIRGLNKPSAFFDEQGAAVVQPVVQPVVINQHSQ